MPVVLSLAIVGFIWQLIYAPEQGLINNVLGGTAQTPTLIDWLGDPSSTSGRSSWPRAGGTSATSWCCTLPA